MATKLPKEIHLLILGSGPEEEKVKEAVKSSINIHYMGYLPKERTISLIRGSDLLVQPSLAEGISSTILEAMACKTPVITTDVGDNKELLNNGTCGIVLEPNSSQKLLENVLDLIDNKQKAESLKEAAFKQVQKYDWSQVGKLYLDIYESLLV